MTIHRLFHNGPVRRWMVRPGLLALMVSIISMCSVASAQTGGATINPISYFEVQEGSAAVSWSQTSTSVDATTGNSVVNFSDGAGGTSTMVWRSNSNVSGNSGGATNTLMRWTLTPVGASSQVYTDGVSQGQIGSFVLTSGAVGNNPIVTVNGQPYVTDGNVLRPTQNSGAILASFVYGGFKYTGVSYGMNYAGRWVDLFTSEASIATTIEDEGPIYFSDGTCANYMADQTLTTYTYQNGSSAPNLLTELNGCPLAVSGNIVSLPIPRSFVWGGSLLNFSACYYVANDNSIIAFLLSYSGNGGSVEGEIDTNGGTPDLAFSDGQGNTVDIQPYGSINQNPNGYQVYQIASSSGTSEFTAFNGVPYVRVDSLLAPQTSVNSFTYGGQTYLLGRTTQAANGNLAAHFQTNGANPQTATLEYSPTTRSMSKLAVNTPSGTATYVDGASVGQPGAYVWSNSSSAPNLLTNVNNNTYTPSGNSDLPGTTQVTNGVFEIKGNFLSLGSWSNYANQPGVYLSYDDGEPVNTPATIEFTASRPLTTWMWDAATPDGTNVTPVMQLDQSSRLLLYPQSGTTTTGEPAVPAPTILLDPSGTNPSQFTGAVHFDGPVRIAPQGDLSMGGFTAEPTPAQ